MTNPPQKDIPAFLHPRATTKIGTTTGTTTAETLEQTESYLAILFASLKAHASTSLISKLATALTFPNDKLDLTKLPAKAKGRRTKRDAEKRNVDVDGVIGKRDAVVDEMLNKGRREAESEKKARGEGMVVTGRMGGLKGEFHGLLLLLPSLDGQNVDSGVVPSPLLRLLGCVDRIDGSIHVSACAT